jgi:hypothetical protein
LPDVTLKEQEAQFAAAAKHFDGILSEAEYAKLLVSKQKRLSYRVPPQWGYIITFVTVKV